MPEQLAKETPAFYNYNRLKLKKILLCATAKMATPMGHHLDSIGTGACSSDLSGGL